MKAYIKHVKTHPQTYEKLNNAIRNLSNPGPHKGPVEGALQIGSLQDPLQGSCIRPRVGEPYKGILRGGLSWGSARTADQDS